MLAGEDASDQEVIRLMLLELIVRRMLRLSVGSRTNFFFLRKHTFILSSGVNAGRRIDGPLADVIDLLPMMPLKTFSDGTTGIPVRLFVRTMVEKLILPSFAGEPSRGQASRPQSFMEAVILPEVADAGLISCDKAGTALDRRCEYTEAGEEALATLWKIIEDGRCQFAKWIDDAPQNAIQFVDRAGSAMLLMPTLAPDVKKLFQLQRYVMPQRQLRGTFRLASLSESYGPGENDGYDAASYLLAKEIDRAWSAMMRELPGVRSNAVPNVGRF